LFVKFTEIVSRLTGFSTPMFGVSWQPPTPDVTIARQVIAFFEDRRILYEAYEFESPDYCYQSVWQMRQFLSRLIGDSSTGAELSGHLRGMRAACRKFMTNVDADRGPDHFKIQTEGERRDIPLELLPRMAPDHELNAAIGELRGVFGIHLGMIATKYGLDVEDELATILPADDIGQT
jgi:hypothetical protein